MLAAESVSVARVPTNIGDETVRNRPEFAGTRLSTLHAATHAQTCHDGAPGPLEGRHPGACRGRRSAGPSRHPSTTGKARYLAGSDRGGWRRGYAPGDVSPAAL